MHKIGQHTSKILYDDKVSIYAAKLRMETLAEKCMEASAPDRAASILSK